MPKTKQLEGVLAENLTQLMDTRKLSIEVVSKMSGVGKGTVDRVKKAEVSTSLENVEKLADAFNVEPTALLSPGMRPSSAVVVRENMVQIPVYDVCASMGPGFQMPTDYVEVIDHMAVLADFIRSKTRFTSLQNLALLTAYGNSMKGTFEDGDLLLVDRGINFVDIDDVFVLALKEQLYIKRLQRRPDGILMISDNQLYPPYLITEKDADKFQVLGRVLLAWNVNNKL